MITSLYAALLSFLILYLTANVISLRKKHRVLHGDQNIQELIVARSAHSNAVECIPITLILLFALEFQKVSPLLIHSLGSFFLVSRLIHCQSILKSFLKGRVIGMAMTIFTILSLAILNLVFYFI